MAKNTAIKIVLVKGFANKLPGDTMTLSKEIAVSIVNRGFANYYEEAPEKETKLKISKKKKDEKNTDDSAV